MGIKIYRGKKTKSITIRIDPEMKEDLEKLAKQDRRKISNYITVILSQHLERSLTNDQ